MLLADEEMKEILCNGVIRSSCGLKFDCFYLLHYVYNASRLAINISWYWNRLPKRDESAAEGTKFKLEYVINKMLFGRSTF